MREIGRVMAVTGDAVTVRHDASAACFGCMNRECRQNQGLIIAENTAGLPLSAGHRVETEFPLKTALAQGFFLLALPFLACAAAYLVSGLPPSPPEEPLRAALGTAALFAAGFALYFYRRKHPFKVRPVILRVL
ncbi:MAG: SoxR reducing system RseC family protein [Treponema sp.]|jgi:sigma-E factor negative regulatory protein RseC|nr:SoxR reducing system RseC family protein [Treponema sp.]